MVGDPCLDGDTVARGDEAIRQIHVRAAAIELHRAGNKVRPAEQGTVGAAD